MLREGYGLGALRADLVAGLTVAIVALPLSMAIAIASGVGPERGLYTSIVGGAIVSLLGGSRYQIGGPAGAFIVLVLGTVQMHGVDGLLLATMLAGAVMLAAGAAAAGDVRAVRAVSGDGGVHGGDRGDHLREPGSGPAGAASDGGGAGGADRRRFGCWLGRWGRRRRRRWRWPALTVGVIAGLAAVAAAVAGAADRGGAGVGGRRLGSGLGIETIGTHFGGIPSSLPFPALPPISLERIEAVLPAALSFALLGSIESLLSAVVADGMSGGRHRSNMELVAQGVANIVSPLFGGITVTGAIARTATNVRSGSRGPVSGVLHSVYICWCSCWWRRRWLRTSRWRRWRGCLATVAWNMAERHAFASLLRASWGDAVVVVTTFLHHAAVESDRGDHRRDLPVGAAVPAADGGVGAGRRT